MARVTCPACDTRTRIPDDHDRSYVRCKECDKKIYLDDQEDDRPLPRSKSRTLSKINRPRSSGSSGLVGFWPLLLLFPLLLLPCLASMHRVGGMLGIGGGVVMAITGFIMAWIAASRAGIGTVGDLPFILQRIPIVHLFYQIKYAIELPKEAGIWVLLEFLGIGVAIVSGILSGRHDMPANHHARDPFFDPRNNLAFVDDGNNANDGFDVNPPPMEAPPEKPLPPNVTGDNAIDQALADLQSGDNKLVRAAADNLARMKPDVNQMVVAERLAEQVRNPDTLAQRAVVHALVVWSSANEVPVLLQIMDETKGPTRKAAFDAVARFNDPRAAAAIVRYFRENPTHPEARAAVVQQGTGAENELLPLLNDKSPIVKRETVKLLKDVGTRQSVLALQPIATGTNVMLRMVAQEAINGINARTKK